MIQLANFEEREFYVMLGKVVTSVDVTFTFQMTEEEFTATLIPISSTLRATKFRFTAITYPEGQYIVEFVETGKAEVLATVAGFVSGNPIFATSQYNTYNDDGTSTTYVPSDDQGLVPSVSQKLRVSTIDQATDVAYVRYLKVTNGTLTDNGDNSVTLDTGGGGAEVLNDLQDVFISAPQETGQTLVYDRDATPRGWHNQKNLLANLGDTNITSTPSNQAFLRYVNGAWEAVPVSIPSPPPDSTDQLSEGNTNLYHTDARVAASPTVAANTAKVGITAEQANAISANTAKVGITTAQADAIVANTAKNSYPSADATKLAGIADGAEVNVNADWNATSGDAQILNKPTIPTDTNLANTNLTLSGNKTFDHDGGTLKFDLNDGGVFEIKDDSDPGYGIMLECTSGATRIFNNLYPTSDGSNGQVMTTDGNMTLSFQTNNSYPSADAAKLAGIAAGAEVNVNADWNASTGDAQILNKPSIPSNIGDLGDVPASLGTAGQVLAVNSGATALEYVDQSGGGGTSFDYARAIMGSDVLQGGGSQQDFNSATPQKVKFNTSADTEGSNITIDTTNNRITVGATGYYRITSNISFTSAAARTTPASFFKVNGTTDLLGEGYGYIRVSSGQDDNNNLITCTVELQANDYVEVWTGDTSTSGGACYATQGFFEIGSAGGAAGATGAQGASGTSYDVTTLTGSTTLSSLHTTKYLVCNSASAMNLTVPASASYDTYAEFVIEQRGAGQVTVVADTGVTIHSTETLKSGAQYAVMGLKRTDTNTYVLTGEREAAP